MPSLQSPADDIDRIRKLHEYYILDTPPEQIFGDMVFPVFIVCAVPIAMITLIDQDRE